MIGLQLAGLTADFVRAALLTRDRLRAALSRRPRDARRSGRSTTRCRAQFVVATAASVAARRRRGRSFTRPAARAGTSPADSLSDSDPADRDDDRRRDARPPQLRRRSRELPLDVTQHLHAPARDSGLVELRDAARQRHRVLRRAGAAAAARRRARRRASRRRWRARAHYFNAHPYLASVAVGALARAELVGRAARAHRAIPHGALRPARQRRRPAGVGGLAAVLLARRAAAFGLGREPLAVVVDLSASCTTPATSRCASGGCTWAGRADSRVASALGNPVLRQGPAQIARAAAAAAGRGDSAHRSRGCSAPAAAARRRRSSPSRSARSVLVRLHGRVEGWKLVARAASLLFALVSVAR